MKDFSSLHCGQCGLPKWYLLVQEKKLIGMCEKCGNLCYVGKDTPPPESMQERNKAIQ